ncbi:pancreatic lipase-related protein 3-like [Vanessa cardui]|uniref:pancreatic lipase-related protein 3-like n=1 Tax=Vanessa cardui TaxID=171605 RepID=UPI001F142E64|nr:pancreatic lipase-related protein 3-like [Vanessa cardui]
MVLFGKSFVIKVFIALGYIAVASCADLRCYDGSFENYQEYSLDDPTPLLNSSCFQSDRITVFYVFGYNGQATGPSVERMITVYLNKVNILLLNWQQEAAVGILGPISYAVTAIPNAKRIGVQFANALIILSNNGLSLSDVHLIGFSLGGQLVGYTGEEVIKQGKIIKKITCLEPAGPLYDGIISLPGVDASVAEYVYAIHTNPGRLGTNEAVATVDIWVNCGNSVQPGCEESGILGLFSNENLCSHDLSWKYFAEALERPTAFLARSASDCDAWKQGEGRNQTIYLGDNIDTEARGNYYLRTNSSSPYGLGAVGSQPGPVNK